jgi:hypothetical protein
MLAHPEPVPLHAETVRGAPLVRRGRPVGVHLCHRAIVPEQGSVEPAPLGAHREAVAPEEHHSRVVRHEQTTAQDLAREPRVLGRVVHHATVIPCCWQSAIAFEYHIRRAAEAVVCAARCRSCRRRPERRRPAPLPRRCPRRHRFPPRLPGSPPFRSRPWPAHPRRRCRRPRRHRFPPRPRGRQRRSSRRWGFQRTPPPQQRRLRYPPSPPYPRRRPRRPSPSRRSPFPPRRPRRSRHHRRANRPWASLPGAAAAHRPARTRRATGFAPPRPAPPAPPTPAGVPRFPSGPLRSPARRRCRALGSSALAVSPPDRPRCEVRRVADRTPLGVTRGQPSHTILCVETLESNLPAGSRTDRRHRQGGDPGRRGGVVHAHRGWARPREPAPREGSVD